MTWYELYNHVCLKLWGSSNPPASAVNLIGPNGMIARAHRDIQRDWNYWFMEASTTISVTAGVSSYALPTNFKELIKKGLQAVDSSSGYYLDPLSPLYPGEAFDSFRDPVNGAPYPTHYEIYEDMIHIYPIPSGAFTIRMRYYKYLDRPTAADFGAPPISVSDALTIACPLGIAALAAMEFAGIQKEADVVQMCLSEVKDSIDTLKQEDQKRRRAEALQVRYADL